MQSKLIDSAVLVGSIPTNPGNLAPGAQPVTIGTPMAPATNPIGTLGIPPVAK